MSTRRPWATVRCRKCGSALAVAVLAGAVLAGNSQHVEQVRSSFDPEPVPDHGWYCQRCKAARTLPPKLIAEIQHSGYRPGRQPVRRFYAD